MNCYHCGAMNPDGAEICGACGGFIRPGAQDVAWQMQQNMQMQREMQAKAWQQDPQMYGMLPPGLTKIRVAWYSGNNGRAVVLLIAAIAVYIAGLVMLFRRVSSFLTIMSLSPAAMTPLWFLFVLAELTSLILILLGHIRLNAPLAWIGAGIATVYLLYGIVSMVRTVRSFTASMVRITIVSYLPTIFFAAGAILVACMVTAINRKYKEYKDSYPYHY